ncbi:MAG: HAMP domain-containing histidine kinase [Nitrospinae bacterium]|nr:HAMP domain-containing histidine kinase [Nitrospinota bacterium]
MDIRPAARLESGVIERHNRILATITHDLKSPMVAIMGSAQFMLKDMKEKPHDPRWEEMLLIIQRAGDGMLSMIEDILAMAKMEAGSEMVETDWAADPAEELRDVVRTFGFEAAAKEIALDIDLPWTLPAVRWDMRRIRVHVINNLVSNALKFTPKGGRVSLSAVPADGAVQIRVSDTGPGISPAERERIFCLFEQAEMKNSRVFKGAGLGLYNARLFVTRHGGTVTVEESGGIGTTFLITLPLDAERR